MIRKWCAVVLLTLSLDGRVIARDPAIACPSAMAKVVSVSQEFGGAPDAQPAIAVLNGSNDDTRTVLIRGPVFGSMDSPDTHAGLACDVSGIALSQTVVRSGQFHGAAAKNIPWRPLVKLIVRLKAASTELTARWNVRLSDGKRFNAAHAARVGERYPVAVSQAIHR